MSKATKALRWGLVACLCGALAPMQAQDTGFSKEFKFRLGYTQNPKDHLRAPYTGFGLNLGYGIGVGRLGLELGYFYKTGDNYFTMPDTSRIAAGREAIDPAKTVVDKRNEFEGLTLRLSYQQDINPTWAWQAGLQIGPLQDVAVERFHLIFPVRPLFLAVAVQFEQVAVAGVLDDDAGQFQLRQIGFIGGVHGGAFAVGGIAALPVFAVLPLIQVLDGLQFGAASLQAVGHIAHIIQ